MMTAEQSHSGEFGPGDRVQVVRVRNRHVRRNKAPEAISGALFIENRNGCRRLSFAGTTRTAQEPG